jgi:hypothetical protein
MGFNILGEHISFEKIVAGPRINVSSQKKKDNRCPPARTQLPTKAMQLH